ncbi:hypothetical protein [Halorhodospira neutriphila]|uniref:Uncharacterized protein n=1 Tax=Halorhodospira neutriphila TaxID=168379 RepID=A0ABS1E1N9_9GAMM|nr:hypothetical protein [Halorhodospira neutriphila]MBK1725700.1 hypothetical protein [Halorhodospira neutriphila]
MSAIKLNEEELEALQSSHVSHEAKLLYITVIRPAMDYGTGIAGRKRTLSYQQIREALEYLPPHGSKRREQRYTREQARGVIRELERAGWIEWHRTSRRGLVFRCRLASWDQCGSSRTNTGPTRDEHRRTNTTEEADNPSAGSDLDAEGEGGNNTGETPCCTAMTNTPPEVRESGMGAHTHTGETRYGGAAGERADAGVCDAPAPGDRFEDWWRTYPKAVGKKRARELWEAKGLDGRADELIADVQLRQGTDRKWVAGYVPNPATYLQQERWNDEIERERPRLQAIQGGRSAPRRGAEGNEEAVRAFLEEG